MHQKHSGQQNKHTQNTLARIATKTELHNVLKTPQQPHRLLKEHISNVLKHSATV